MSGGQTYLSAGVDRQALDGIKDRIGAFARITHGPQVLSGIGGFSSLFHLTDFSDPVLVTSTDGVGTKLRIGSMLGHFESLGMDLVNMNLGDIVTSGAKPLMFLDYISMGTVDSQRTESLLRGITWACKEAGCALVGGETAQTPGVYIGDNFDLAGFAVGVVERDKIIDGSGIQAGDALVGIPSTGVHTNGFSLVHKVFRTEEDPTALYRKYDELEHTLGEELLIPHRPYYPLMAGVVDKIKGAAHITGGGLESNVPRMLPPGLMARLGRSAWETQPIFSIIQREGGVEPEEMLRVFNMGLGMVLACAPDRVGEIEKEIPDSRAVGEVQSQTDELRVVIS